MSRRGYAAIGLDNPKSPINVGGVLRAAAIYEVSMIALAGQRFRRWPSDTRQAWRHMPVIEVDDLRGVVPFDCVPVAVDLVDGAKPLPEYVHPARAYYVFGPEDSTLGTRITSWCRDVIYVPGNGCMNLAAAVNVILYDRLAKETAGWPTYKRERPSRAPRGEPECA